MKIIYSDDAKLNLISIKKFIKLDNINSANKFISKLKFTIEELDNFPYKYRKSIYFEDESIRDMIFNGYTIIYQIDKIQQQIKILEIFNQNLPKLGINKNENN